MQKQGIIRCFLLMFLLLFVCNPVIAGDSTKTTVADTVYDVVEYYNDQQLDNWEQLTALNSAGEDLRKWTNISNWDKDILDEKSAATVYAGRILGLLALEQDPANYKETNLIEVLKGKQQANGAFGGSINNTIWAIMALDAAGADYNKENAIKHLISEKKTDGGYAISGNLGDPDTTGDALLALSKYKEIIGVNEAISDAVAFLENAQLETAGFTSWGSENSQSIAKAIVGLLAVEEEIIAEKWMKNQITIIDALLAYQLADNSFKFTPNGNRDDMATRQVLIALVALKQNGYGDYIPNPVNSAPDQDDESVSIKVTVRVEGVADSETVLPETEVEVTTDSRMFEALAKALDGAGINNNVANIAEDDMLSLEDIEVNTAYDISHMYWMYTIDDNLDTGANPLLADGNKIAVYLCEWPTTAYAKISVDKEQAIKGEEITVTVEKSDGGWPANYIPADNVIVKFGQEEKITDINGQATFGVKEAGTYEIYAEQYNQDGIPVIVKTATKQLSVEATKVTVRVEGVADSGTVLPETEVEITAGTRMFDALAKALDGVGINNNVANIAENGMLSLADIEVNTSYDISHMYWMYTIDDNLDTGANPLLADGNKIAVYLCEWPTTAYAKISVDKEQAIKGEEITVIVEKSDGGWPANYIPADNAIVVFGKEEKVTDINGQATFVAEEAGTYEIYAEQYNQDGMPVIVKTAKVVVLVKDKDSGGTSPDNQIAVYVEVVGKNTTHFTGRVTLDKNNATPIEALKETGVNYRTRDNNSYVYEIAGEREDLSGTAGWKYKVGSVIPSTAANQYTLKDGDNLLWFWADDYTATEPGSGKKEELKEEIPISKEVEEVILKAVEKLEERINLENLASNLLTEVANVPSIVIGADKPMTEEQKKELEKLLKDNVVSIAQRVEAGQESNITDEKNEVNLKLGKETLKEAKEITVVEKTADENVNLPPNYNVVSSIYEFGPNGTVFAKPAYMSIRIIIPDDVNYEELVLACYNEEKEQWLALPTVVDVSTGTITAAVEHFSKFAVLVREQQQIYFADISEEQYPWAVKEINYLATRNIVQGVGQNKFEPAREVNRAELTAMLVKALDLDYTVPYKGVFQDVHKDAWYAGYVQAAVDNGIIKGLTDNTFGPTDQVTREQLAVMMARVLGKEAVINMETMELKDHEQIAPWAVEGVLQVISSDIFRGFPDGTFRPKEVVSRAQSATVIYRLLVEY